MKILMDFRKFTGVIGGVERGVIEIVKYVTQNKHSVVLLCKKISLEQTTTVFDGVQNLKITPLDVDTHIMNSDNARLDSTTIQDIAVAEKADVIHFPYNWSFPSNKKVPSVLTVHDVIPFTFREAMGLIKNLFSYKPGMRKACQLNDIIATVSEYSKNDIAAKIGVSKDKIRVIPNGLRDSSEPDAGMEHSLKDKFGLQNGFVLNVGGIHERKNIVRLVEAFAGFVKKVDYKGKLLITGSVAGAPYQEKMKKICDKAINNSGVSDRIVFTGFIPDDELDSLFRICDFLVYPSLYEGFGIPILEAMQAGTAVITSNVTAMPEVAGGAALLIDPLSCEDMIRAMVDLHSNNDLRMDLIEKGKVRAQAYSWRITSEKYLALYNEICGK